MEAQIFYWTGCVVWWGICAIIVLCMATLVICTPIWAFTKSRRGWWRWVTVARFAELGWSNEELKTVLTSANITDVDFFYTAKKVIEVGKMIKKTGLQEE